MTDMIHVRSDPHNCTLPARYPVEREDFRRVQRLDDLNANDANAYSQSVYARRNKAHGTCKIAKLSFVAGAELPKRYVVT